MVASSVQYGILLKVARIDKVQVFWFVACFWGLKKFLKYCMVPASTTLNIPYFFNFIFNFMSHLTYAGQIVETKRTIKLKVVSQFHLKIWFYFLFFEWGAHLLVLGRVINIAGLKALSKLQLQWNQVPISAF